MSVTEVFANELEREAANTRRMLERTPVDKFDWSPHPKSMNILQLATHIAVLAGRVAVIVNSSHLDFAKNSGKKIEILTTRDLIELHDEGARKSVAALRAAKDDILTEHFVLKNGDHTIFDLQKEIALRSNGMNHLYHHRAQLGVYLRLLDIPIPGMYGLSADEQKNAK
ncbi:MAG: DinB family protein [Chitinophagaceae bacterium]|nr:DinB family protein [Chitinophagaceae bacterium]